jgi:quercetin dioxygenase-like cupin family protein
MKLIEFSNEHAQPIQLFESVSASSVRLADGSGEAHVYCVYFSPGGRIGEHRAGFGQLFLVVHGEGWAAGEDGRRVKLSVGQGVYFERGELHSKGSESGMATVMVQVAELEPYVGVI